MFMFTLELNTLTYILPTDALLYFIFCVLMEEQNT